MRKKKPGHSQQGNLYSSACFPNLHQRSPAEVQWKICCKSRASSSQEYSWPAGSTVQRSGGFWEGNTLWGCQGWATSSGHSQRILSLPITPLGENIWSLDLLEHVDLAVVPWVEFESTTLLRNGFCVVAVHARLQPRGVNHCFLQSNTVLQESWYFWLQDKIWITYWECLALLGRTAWL